MLNYRQTSANWLWDCILANIDLQMWLVSHTRTPKGNQKTSSAKISVPYRQILYPFIEMITVYKGGIMLALLWSNKGRGEVTKVPTSYFSFAAARN